MQFFFYSWSMLYFDVSERGALLDGLKPDTLYAIYIKTAVQLAPGSRGAMSRIQYARTVFASRLQFNILIVRNGLILIYTHRIEKKGGKRDETSLLVGKLHYASILNF